MSYLLDPTDFFSFPLRCYRIAAAPILLTYNHLLVHRDCHSSPFKRNMYSKQSFSLTTCILSDALIYMVEWDTPSHISCIYNLRKYGKDQINHIYLHDLHLLRSETSIMAKLTISEWSINVSHYLQHTKDASESES